jgi:hypothetical protein
VGQPALWEAGTVNIGRPKRIIEVKPESLPLPELLPDALPDPIPEREPEPVQPSQPAERSR